jgi:hypothetical protein
MKLAIKRFNDQEVEHYQPLVLSSKPPKNGKKRRIIPLFYEYVFVRTLINGIRALKETLGVIQVLSRNVPDSFVEGLRRMENKHGIVVLLRSRFKKGQKVKLSRLDHAICSFYDKISVNRVRVLLEMFGSERIIEALEGDLVEV